MAKKLQYQPTLSWYITKSSRRLVTLAATEELSETLNCLESCHAWCHLEQSLPNKMETSAQTENNAWYFSSFLCFKTVSSFAKIPSLWPQQIAIFIANTVAAIGSLLWYYYHTRQIVPPKPALLLLLPAPTFAPTKHTLHEKLNNVCHIKPAANLHFILKDAIWKQYPLLIKSKSGRDKMWLIYHILCPSMF